jgi:hypothetical protein
MCIMRLIFIGRKNSEGRPRESRWTSSHVLPPSHLPSTKLWLGKDTYWTSRHQSI